MSKSILYLLLLCLLCLSCKVKAKLSSVPVIPLSKSVEKAPVNVLAATSIEVDSHGQAMDTDGDGIPDYRDHEKLTSSRCFPVDSNGVGYCREPECYGIVICKLPIHDNDTPRCQIGTFEISFASRSSVLSDSALKVLNVLLQQAYSNPECKLVIGDRCGAGKEAMNICRERTKKIITFFYQKNITANRIVFGL